MEPAPNRLGMSVGSTAVVRPDTKPDAGSALCTGRCRATSPEYLSSQKPCVAQQQPMYQQSQPIKFVMVLAN